MSTLNDLWYAWLQAVTPASSGGTGTGAISNSSQVANQYATTANVGTQTAPTASTTIASLSASATGYYRIRVNYGYGATAEATTPDNFVFNVNATNITNLPATLGNANTMFSTQEFFRQLTSGDVVRIRSGGTAGSAGSIYKGFITMDRLA